MEKRISIEAYAEAVRFEKEGRDYFLGAAAKAKDEATRQIFQQIAEEEIRHIAVINEIYKDMKEKGSWDDTQEKLPGSKGNKNRFTAIAEKLPTAKKAASEDIKALEHAMEIEKKGRAFYEAKASETDIENEKKFFILLALEEEGHYLTFSDALDYLVDPEGWMERKERGAYDGA